MLLRIGADTPFSSQETVPTIGVDCKSKTFMHDDLRVRLQIWDTAGQEKYHALAKNYYQGASGRSTPML